MPQLYLFIGGIVAITIIVARRGYVYSRDKKIKFKEEVNTKVNELHKERQQMQKERFKESLFKEQKTKKYDFAQYKLIMREADMALAKKNWNEAKKFLIQALALTRDEIPVSIKLASVYFESGDIKRAESIYRRLLEIEGGNTSILERLAKICVKKKHYKEAVQYYVQAIEIDDKDDKKLVGLGRLYQLLMHSSLAGECFRRAAELKPREVEYLFLLADSCEKDGDHENALFAYEKILTMEPYNERAKSKAQDVRIKMNEMEKIMTS